MSFLFINDQRGHYPDSWYAASSTIPAPHPGLHGAVRADVCVIGAGYTGLSAALHLAGRGYDVVVLEAHRAGFGASGRNGGQVGSGLNHPQSKLEKTMGAGPARQFWDMTQAAKALVRDLAPADAGYAPGVAHADFHQRDTDESHREADHLARHYGYDQVECMDQTGVQDVIKSTRYTGGVIDWGAGHLHPLRYALGLAQKATQAGAVIYENSPVTRIDGAQVHTAQGHVKADHIILATNGYHDLLHKKTARHVMPINNYLVATAPLDDPAQVLGKNIAVADNRFVLNYYRLSHDNRLIFGGGESYGARFPQDIFAKVRPNLREIFPQIGNVELTHAWGGTLGITTTRLPMFARFGDNGLCNNGLGNNGLSAAGYSGHGVALATFAGKVMADAIAGQAERFDLLAQLPHPPFPGGPLMRAPIMTLAMIWFAMRDRLGI